MAKRAVSIVVPVWNEEENIYPLISEIHRVMDKDRRAYEIIVVDDHSTDGTVSVLNKLASTHPIHTFRKKGSKGKAQSLIEGFTYTKYNLICMIDADLQYPPQAIPQMIEKIEKGADIVEANRRSLNISLKR